jgi:hypothetical protein
LSSITTAERIVVNYLKERGLSAKGSAWGNAPDTDQRHNMIYALAVDLADEYPVGHKAAGIAVEKGSGYLSTILCERGPVH